MISEADQPDYAKPAEDKRAMLPAHTGPNSSSSMSPNHASKTSISSAVTDEEIMAAWMSQRLLEIEGTISDDGCDEPEGSDATSDGGDDHEDQ